MPFGYNATLAISDHAIKRLVDADFDQVPDALWVPLPMVVRETSLFYGDGEFHFCWHRRPFIDLDVSDRPSSVRNYKNIVMRFPSFWGYVFRPTPNEVPSLLLSPREFNAIVNIYCSLTINETTNELQLDLSDVIEEDIAVEVRRVQPRFFVEVTQDFIKQAFVNLLNLPIMSIFTYMLSININLDYDMLRTSNDPTATIGVEIPVAFDDTTASPWAPYSRDNITLPIFERVGGEVLPGTRGDRSLITNTRESDSSFTARISDELLLANIDKGMNRRFMRYVITVPHELPPDGTEVLDEDHQIYFSIVPEAENPTIRMRGLATYSGNDNFQNRDNVMGTVTNLAAEERGETIETEFETGDNGEFDIEIAGFLEDDLQFSGDFIIRDPAVPPLSGFWLRMLIPYSIEIGFETIRGRPDYRDLRLAGTVVVYHGDACFIVEYEYGISPVIDIVGQTLDIHFNYDSLGGRKYFSLITLIALEHLGCLWWIGLAVYGGLIDRVENYIRSTFSDELEGTISHMLQTFSEDGRYQIFYNELTIDSEEDTVVTGQLEAGRIRLDRNGDNRIDQRVLEKGNIENTIVLDREGDDYVALSVLNNGLYIAYHTEMEFDRWNSQWYVGNGGVFEQQDADRLSRRSGSRPGFVTSTAAFSEMVTYTNRMGMPEGAVFGVRMPWGTLSKIRVNHLSDTEDLVRWVTYEKPPEPYVGIEGTLVDYFRRYRGEFSVVINPPDGSARRFYDPDNTGFLLDWTTDFDESKPTIIWNLQLGSWSLSGGTGRDEPLSFPGVTITPVESNWSVIRLEINPAGLPSHATEPLGARFSGTLTITAHDIFGRSPTATVPISGFVRPG